MPTCFVGSAAAGTPYLVRDRSRGLGVVKSFALSEDGELEQYSEMDVATEVSVGSNPTAIVQHPGGLLVSDETYGDESNSRLWCAKVTDWSAISWGSISGVQNSPKRAGDAGSEPGVQNFANSGGRACCHLAVHPSGNLVAASNYLGEAPAFDPANKGSLAIFKVGPNGIGERTTHIAHSHGAYPGANAARQEAAHIHSSAWATLDVDGKTALLVCDLGSDKIWQYIVDDLAGVAEPNPTQISVDAHAPGAGPRHIAMHPAGGFAFVICEMASTVQVHSYDPSTGCLSTSLQSISTLPPGAANTYNQYSIPLFRSCCVRQVTRRLAMTLTLHVRG